MPIETKHADRRIRTFKVAKDCAELGATFRTICSITGLARREVIDLFRADGATLLGGRPPISSEWYHTANLLNRIEASIVISIYRRIRDLGFEPAEALVAAYRHYQAACRQHPRINFDRAFHMVSHVDGVWLAKSGNLSLLLCKACSSQYVAATSAKVMSAQDCPFCKLLARFPLEARIQSAFPVRDTSDLSNLESVLVTLARHECE
jgi:hypothetical protein